MYSNFNGFPMQPQRVPQPFPQMPPMNPRQGPFIPGQFPPSQYPGMPGNGQGAPYNFDFGANNFQNQNRNRNSFPNMPSMPNMPNMPNIPSPVQPAQPNIPSNFPSFQSGDNVPTTFPDGHDNVPTTAPPQQTTAGSSPVDQSVPEQQGGNAMDNNVPTAQLSSKN